MEIKIENKIFLNIFKNNDNKSKTVHREVSKNQIQFHFNIDGEFKLKFGKNYDINLNKNDGIILYNSKTFCFTGTFLYGKRKECEDRVLEKGGKISTLRLDLNYLIIGVYATGAWAHSHFGRKIEKAVAFNNKGADIKIINEADWIETV